jgi:protein-disulfide isomerase
MEEADCARMYPAAKQLVDSSGSRVNLVIRLLPIPSHPHGEALAAAAVCVAAQKGAAAFYGFADRIFARSAPVAGDTLTSVAPIVRDFGVDSGKLEECVSSIPVAERIMRSAGEGPAIGVSGTPATVLLDVSTGRARIVVGIRDVEQLRDAIATLND